ncbi:hypothetical protein A4A49_01631 [Nicotiana attenuata]|uniref:FAF domain-containing protein n=1 Tax=Nicotiana attenuata TaxID=49451 RepID=A0A1J6JGX9_NICAT|nr:hypothetical protein A4A49_01631 [Nicotiana attenuata]
MSNTKNESAESYSSEKEHHGSTSCDELEDRPNSFNLKESVDYCSETLTESLGFESLNEKVKCSFEELELLTVERRSRANTTAMRTRQQREGKLAVTSFPPLLSSLKKNGRPRSSLVKVRENGRLQISSVRNNRPEVLVVRSPPSADDESSDGGRLRVKFINGGDSSSSDDEQENSEIDKNGSSDY